MCVTNRDIINIIEQAAPCRLQEDYDNSGLQCGQLDVDCTGVLLCVDVTPDIVDEAVSRHCNLIISHHPLLFHGVKQVIGDDRVTCSLINAIKSDVAIYSSHTALDNAPEGISHAMARRLGLLDVKVLEPVADAALGTVGSGVIGLLATPMDIGCFVSLVKSAFHSPVARCSNPGALESEKKISRIALCGGAGTFLVGNAVRQNADAFITSDSKFNYFLDYADKILLVDIGHYESEECAKEIFYHIITKKIPNFAVHKSQREENPIKYL